MTPADLLASASQADRARGAGIVYDRTHRGGLTREEALARPIARRGGARPPRPREDDTLEAIGDALGLCRERVRQIERDAMRKLRAALEREGLTAQDVRAWLDSKASDPDAPASYDAATSYLRREERVSVPEEMDADRRARAAREHEREADAMVREIRETAAAHRLIERVCSGMEDGGHVSVLSEEAAW